MGFTDDLAKVNKPDRKYNWYPSYNSKQWRKDMSDSIRHAIDYIMKSPFGKAVVGFHTQGGMTGSSKCPFTIFRRERLWNSAYGLQEIRHGRCG